MTLVESINVRRLGRVEYLPTLEKMRRFTAERTHETPDELWVLEHPPVYTLGQGATHRPVGNGIPVLKADRGGDITYHGPGQLIVYTLVDLARRGIQVRRFVHLLEQSVIDLVGARAHRRAGAPGVYVDHAKIAALGIRIRQGRAYHGLSLNVDMDLDPFRAIDPCGYAGMKVTQTAALGMREDLWTLGERLAGLVTRNLEHA